MPENDRSAILRKRMDGLRKLWKVLSEKQPQYFKGCTLNRILLREAVENYLNDRDVYKLRHRITGANKIMLHKVAGLMAASICKFKPIQIHHDPSQGVDDTFQNERFALWHGLAVCAEPYRPRKEVLDVMLQCELFYELEKEMLGLFQRRPDSADAFVVIFRALCIKYLTTTVESNAEGE
jgi:hypothetical protein